MKCYLLSPTHLFAIQHYGTLWLDYCITSMCTLKAKALMLVWLFISENKDVEKIIALISDNYDDN